ncbi:ATP-binding cassette subfamily A (ABC1) member 3 [Microdochium nivale]|nr:ATP-binding cassette subfamily A (ABC1) member 3 [Microdochium nivale]
MANTSLFRSQLLALLRKNFMTVLVRSWKSTLFRAAVFPIVFVALLLCIPKFEAQPNKSNANSGVNSIRSLKDAMGSKPLAIYRSPEIGSDINHVLETITKPLDSSLVRYLNVKDDAYTVCPVDYNGNSPCFAMVMFNDSPLSGRVNASWDYTMRFNPSAMSRDSIDVLDRDNIINAVRLPLLNAIESAMLNSTIEYDTMLFTTYSERAEQTAKWARYYFLQTCLSIINFAFYFVIASGAHHISSVICQDRDSGMSDLVDAMGGGAAWSRVISNILFFDALYLPSWIVLAVLFQTFLFQHVNFGLTLMWLILTGLATISLSTFLASLFKKGSQGPLMVGVIILVLAVGGAMTEFANKTPVGMVLGLAAVFPPMNFIFFLNFLLRSELVELQVVATQPLPIRESRGFWDVPKSQWYNEIGPFVFLIFLTVHIFVFLCLAWLVESKAHGNNRVRRSFNTTSEGEASHVAIKTSGLVKHYPPGFWRRVFCCGRAKHVKAVNDLDLTCHKRQIMCLLGPNGSGKTTTLEILAGYQKPTSGCVELNATPSSMGICPQKNTMWDTLTVREHLDIWNILKGGLDDASSIDKLMETCDLTLKKDSLAGSLSGGMKRKLQLACMLVGGSSICLLDEVTSGLDPISRRVIWNAILQERSRRTMILTTHFLDESEVLSDHITILTLGKMKCQGTPAELKSQYGSGYRVHVPKTVDISSVESVVEEKNDRYIITTPDSASASTLLASLSSDADDSQMYITGPTIEDVFLKVAEEPHALVGESLETVSHSESMGTVINSTPTKRSPRIFSIMSLYPRQLYAFLIKRVLVLRSYWWAYVLVLFLPIIITWGVRGFIMNLQTNIKFDPPTCESQLIRSPGYDSMVSTYSMSSLALGPEAFNQTTADIIESINGYLYSFSSFYNPSIVFGPFVHDDRQKLVDFVLKHPKNVTDGAIWLGEKPLVMVSDQSSGFTMLHLANMVRSNTTIKASVGTMASYTPAEAGMSFIYITLICLAMFLYPCFFALYPTYERRSQVRALQFSNGVRPLPMWLAYLIFDLTFVLVIAAVCTALMATAANWFSIGHVFLVLVLYGIVAIEIVYLVTLISRSELAAFSLSFLFMGITYVVSVITMILVDGQKDRVTSDGIAFGLGLIFPVMNLFRSLAIGLNTYEIRCRESVEITDPSSIYAYGGTIMLLIIQIIAYGCFLLWVEGSTFAWLASVRKSSVHTANGDDEKEAGKRLSGRPDVDAETRRVEESETDLLRILHVTKQFGSGANSNVAVDNISIGLREGEILALLGPNGAGKTTAINCIRGDLSPSDGRILLEGIDTHKNMRLAQQRLGVCPQFDALDLLTVHQHLRFYARCKGVDDIEHDVNQVMTQVGLTVHADKLGSKLSGGNKRKLSLAIALLGNPPVLLLDEPSSSMDAASKRVLWKVLRAVAPGRSILMTTHSMEEADALATRAAIVAKRMLAIGSTQELRKAHSNEYHVHLILKTAPLSSADEMADVARWVEQTFPNIHFEGENLGGQVRFIVPADSKVPQAQQQQEDQDTAQPVQQQQQHKSFVRYMIDTLEARKEQLGLDCYTIGAATMESVFLSVVKESDAWEEEAEKKRPWWKMFGKTI